MNRKEKIQTLKAIEAGIMNVQEIITPKFDNLTTDEIELLEYMISNEQFSDPRLDQLLSKLYCKQQ